MRFFFGFLITAFLLSDISMAKERQTFTGSISLVGKSKSHYLELAKITLQEAVAIATKTTSGKVIEAALDKENSFLVYEIELVMPDHSRREVLIDAGNGQILLTKDVGNQQDLE